jgi:predicted ATP-grasp superfamily ATP-dependent carboligase
MSEYQEEVLTGLLGLQAELRGDEPESHEPAAKASPEASISEDGDGVGEGDDAGSQETIAVTEDDVTVSLSSGSVSSGPHSSGSLSSGPSIKGLSVNERLAALNERLGQLEYDLAGVTKRIERIEPDPEVESSGSTDTDVDARWRSFLDLQKIVADRLDQR